MKKYFLFTFLLPIICFAQNTSKHIIHYNIYATLNSDNKTVNGFEKIIYTNTSDTAQLFLWIRLYPNAYANDRTKYSDYMSNQGDLRYYFSKEEEKGYINQLDFKQNDVALNTAFDSSNNDLIKVYLQNPLQPEDSVEITTTFFVKIPYNFSGFGYNDDDEIRLTHWYPEVAYQNESGWELKPFINYYSNFQNNDAIFDVKIIADKNNYQTDIPDINKYSQDNKTVYEFHLKNKSDALFTNSLGSVVQTDLTLDEEQNFDKLIPNFLANKRPDNPQATQYLINQKIYGIDSPLRKSLKPAFLFNLSETDKYNYLSFLPAIGYNNYDKAILGIMVHNYQLPLNKFNFLIAPMYATNTKMFAGVGRLAYNIWNKNDWWKFSVSGERYTYDKYVANYEDGSSLTKYLKLLRIVPSINYTRYYDDNRNNKLNLNLRAFILHQDTVGAFLNPFEKAVLTEMKVTFSNDRALYPYNANLKIDGDKDFLRIGFTGNGFLNYDASGKGLNVRLFAGKFFYLNSNAQYNTIKNYYLRPYFLSLSSSGWQDYTYSDYFVGRNETTGWMSQQIAQNDGFFKIATPANNYSQIGVSDNWIAALNFTADIPDKINPFAKLPFNMPIRAFLDIGTYSGGWSDDNNAPSGKYLYDAGLQVSLFNEVLNIYFPLLYSKIYRDDFKQIPNHNFAHTISFSINLENLKPKVLHKILPL